MRAVISLGGSVVGFPPDVEWLKAFRSFVEEFKEDIVAIVVGGGPLARQMMSVAARFGVTKDVLDEIGIATTMLNAWIVRSALDGLVLDRPLHFSGPMRTSLIPVFGGSVLPGITTDFVAALLAEHHGAAFVNITRVGGIYDKDPDRFPDAKLIKKLSYEEAEKLVFSSDRREPGTHFPVDVAAFSILRRSNIKAYIVGKDIENLRRLFRGEGWTGTELTP
ncbi:MAG: UMP kinase [Candidatus Diapherotrites archaeon]|nr:UMP kinase [Candidatus Diapherotrites archaeon]